MARKFDFRALQQETMEITLNDDTGTVLHVTTPPERLIEQMVVNAEELEKLKGPASIEQSRAAFELGASVISCNVEGVTVTAEELRDKYKTTSLFLALFFVAYMEFIDEVKNAKN